MVGDTQPDSGEAPGKRVTCYRCGRGLRVSPKALSVFCPHCQQRLVLESLHIDKPHPAREVLTCGDILIEAGIQLQLQRILGHDIVIRGRVIGKVIARGNLEVARTGYIEGDVEAGNVSVSEGGILKGNCKIVRISPTRDQAVGQPMMPSVRAIPAAKIIPAAGTAIHNGQ